MDPDYKFFLVKLGVILDNQNYDTNLSNSLVIICDLKFKIVLSENFFRLKNISNNLFLYCDNNTIDFVVDNQSELFKRNSKFLILNDSICCSIFPFNNYRYIVCSENKIIKLKKVISCLQNDIVTIFQLKKDLQKKKEVKCPVKKSVNCNKNLVKMNDLSESLTKQMNYLTIITPNYNIIPESLKKYSYYKQNTMTSLSLCYLSYIINNWDNFTNGILFINFFPNKNEGHLLEKKLISGCPNNIITYLNNRLTLDGMRYKYLDGDIWSDWQDINISSKNLFTKNKIVNFIKKYIKKMPKTRYLEYSSNGYYYITKKMIIKNRLSFYENIFKLLKQNPSYSEIMDKCWYFIFN